MNNSRKFDTNLIKILNYLFIPDDSGKDYIINEKISFKEIDEIIEKVRKIIMELYITCDKDYREGIKLFEKILLDKNIELAEKRLKYTGEYKKNNYGINNYGINNYGINNNGINNNDIKKRTDIEDNYINEMYKRKDFIKKDLEKENKKIKKKAAEEEQKKEEENKRLQQREYNMDIGNKSMNFIENNMNLKLIYELQERGLKIKKKYDENLCPHGHDLSNLRCDYDDCEQKERQCDICNKYIKKNTFYRHCKICDFDICDDDERQHISEMIVAAYIDEESQNSIDEESQNSNGKVQNSIDEVQNSNGKVQNSNGKVHMSIEKNRLKSLNQ
jgi:hypothetical protein